MTRKELDRIRALLSKTVKTLQAVGIGQVDLFLVTQNIAAIEAALVVTDPDRPRELTTLGKRIVEAAEEVGFSAYRLERALQGSITSRAFKRLLYQPVKAIDKLIATRLIDVIGCEPEWLLLGKGERRKKPIHPGLVLARMLGASEEAIHAVMRRDAMVFDRSDQDWALAFLEETRRLVEAPPEPSSPRLR